MKSVITALFLIAATTITVLCYPGFAGTQNPTAPAPKGSGSILGVTNPQPRVEVVFVLDTTGSMSGLIDAAKEKIWSIATTMAQARPAPEIRIGLVAYRDRGDAYITRVTNLSEDLDSVYSALMDLQADGGGDGPESVNRALYDAVNEISWSDQADAYQAIFLVGDAPPHMDYVDEPQYPEVVAQASARGIVVNTIQCGRNSNTVDPWRHIANLSQGRYFQVEQAGSAVAINTPYDADLAKLSARLDDTRLFYGNAGRMARMEKKLDAAAKLHAEASPAARARRAEFNASASGGVNLFAEGELVEDVTRGRISLEEIPDSHLPLELAPMSPAERKAKIEKSAQERETLVAEIRSLTEQRQAFIARKLDEEGGAADSLDQKIYEALREQSAEKGLSYEDGPAY